MHFPVEDVIKNVRAFVSSVKRATGNREADQAEKKKDSTKPGKLTFALGRSVALILSI
jgi:large subunit ribosomal protein L1